MGVTTHESTEVRPAQISPTVTQESRPVPDPTDRTKAELHREGMWQDRLRDAEVKHLKDLFREATTQRDKAIDRLQDVTDRAPTIPEVNGRVDALKESTEKGFDGIDKQLTNLKADSNKALDAALQAQEKSAIAATASLKESIQKSEGQTTKSIEGLQREQSSAQVFVNEKIESQRKAFESKIEDVKRAYDARLTDLTNRVTNGEGQSKGKADFWGWIVAAVTMVIGAASVIVTLLVKQ